jgi:hypothetical protein
LLNFTQSFNKRLKSCLEILSCFYKITVIICKLKKYHSFIALFIFSKSAKPNKKTCPPVVTAHRLGKWRGSISFNLRGFVLSLIWSFTIFLGCPWHSNKSKSWRKQNSKNNIATWFCWMKAHSDELNPLFH